VENRVRSFLFVPADEAEKIEKACQAGADCVVLDLEDGVANPRKAIARENVQRVLETSRPSSSTVLVRVNPDPPYRNADIEAAVRPGVFGIMLPKSNTPKDVIETVKELAQAERRAGIAEGNTRLFLLIETARGFLTLPPLTSASDRVAGLVFGAEDWCRDMGIARTKAGRELEVARWHLAVCAHAHGLHAIDTIYGDFHDTDGLLRDTENARRIGFTGKLAIHPKQIATIHASFAPSHAEVSEAAAIVEAFDQAEAQGRGVVAVNGRMVDKPVAERFRRILFSAEKGK
jgi:citrate lyase subunit beta/citryl-CoA lyase